MKKKPVERIIATHDGLRAPHGTIGDCILRLRTERGWTQCDVARRLRVSQPSVKDWEIGKSAPSRKNTKLLAIEFAVPVEFLRAHPRSLFDGGATWGWRW